MSVLKRYNGTSWETVGGVSRIPYQASAPAGAVQGDLWVDSDETPSGSSVAVVGATRTSGNVTLNGTSWSNVDTGVDLVIPAVAGDWLEVSIQMRVAAGASNTHTFFDVATIVGGSPVNYFGTAGGATDEGVLSWRCNDTLDEKRAGSVLRQVVSGDLSGGNATLRLRYRQDTAGNRLFVAGTTNPFKWWVKNLG